MYSGLHASHVKAVSSVHPSASMEQASLHARQTPLSRNSVRGSQVPTSFTQNPKLSTVCVAAGQIQWPLSLLEADVSTTHGGKHVIQVLWVVQVSQFGRASAHDRHYQSSSARPTLTSGNDPDGQTHVKGD